MSAAPLLHVTRYARGSSLDSSAKRLSLATPLAPPHADEESALDFLVGRIERPRPFASALLVTGRAAASRFHVPPAMLERLIRESDPVVTSDSTHARFESFSACCGVYARVDLPLDAIEGDAPRRGTTNVDLGPELRGALTSVESEGRLDLAIGPERFTVDAGAGEVVERRVPLPARWLRGFLEVQAIQRRLVRGPTLAGVAALRFLQSMPRAATRGGVAFAPTSTGLRVTRPGARGAFVMGGHERLGLFDGVAASLRSMTVYVEPREDAAPSATAWVAELEGGLRLTLLLSAERWRGLSGEGQALEELALVHSSDSGESAAGAVARVQGALRWQGTLETAGLARQLELDASSVDSALAALGGRGLVGFDVVEGRYFHRVLPFDFAEVERLQPRLADARRLVVAGALSAQPDGHFEVTSGKRKYRVELTGTGPTCTCTWFAKHRGARGPCKHVLAVQLAGHGDEREVSGS